MLNKTKIIQNKMFYNNYKRNLQQRIILIIVLKIIKFKIINNNNKQKIMKINKIFNNHNMNKNIKTIMLKTMKIKK